MKKISLFVMIVLVAAAHGSDRRLVRIHIDTPGQAGYLARQDLDLASRRIAAHADAVLSPAEERALQDKGFRLEILTPPASLRKTAAALSGDMGAYHTYQELTDELLALASAYPQILMLTSIGRSIEGRGIWAVKISDHPAQEEPDEAEVLLTAAIHAREIITPEILLDFIHYLTTFYGQDSLLTRLVDERQIWLVPMINPDGHVRVENGDIWWRKNCRPNPDGSIGIDLNRNFGYMWGYDDYGSSPVPRSETYRGPSAFSEPETAALRDFAAAHRFVAVLNYHSYSRVAIFPWAYVAEHTLHHPIFMELGRNLTEASGYEYGDAAMGILYGTNGDADDFFYGEALAERPVFSFTIEVGTDFHPPEGEISQLISENRPANLYISYIADRLMRAPWQIVPADSSGQDSTATSAPAAEGEPARRQPLAFNLDQNYPNPFNAGTTVRYTLPEQARVGIALFDALGRCVRRFDEQIQPAGEHRFSFDAGELPSGLYLCRVMVSSAMTAAATYDKPAAATIKMLLLR